MDVRLIPKVVTAIIKSLRNARSLSQGFLADIMKLSDWLAYDKISRDEFVENARSLVADWADKLYREGSGDYRELTAEDEVLISDWITEQLTHLDGLADVIDTVGLVPHVVERLRMWAESMASLSSMGYMQSNRNRMARWVKGLTDNGCKTCSGLDGVEWPLGWFLDQGFIPRQPGSSALSCGGWRCRCKIIDAKTGRRILPIVSRWRLDL